MSTTTLDIKLAKFLGRREKATKSQARLSFILSAVPQIESLKCISTIVIKRRSNADVADKWQRIRVGFDPVIRFC